MSETLQKETVQTYNLGLRKHQICVKLFGTNWRTAKTAKSEHILDAFSALDDQIELIPFALFQKSPIQMT